MNCGDFKSFLGLVVDENNISSLYISTIHLKMANMIISAALLFFVIIYFIVLLITKRKIMEYINNIIEHSIFSFFNDLHFSEENKAKNHTNDEKLTRFSLTIEETGMIAKNPNIKISTGDITTSRTSFELSELRGTHKSLESSLKEDKESSFEETYICNFYECCCECFCYCWLNEIYNQYIVRFYNGLINRIREFFKENVKFFSFFCIILGNFIFRPIRDIFTLIQSECFEEIVGNYYIYLILKYFIKIFDMFLGSLSLVIFLFIISFLETQGEFLKTYLFDKTYRARMIYFHFRRALIFGGLDFIIKLVYNGAFFYTTLPNYYSNFFLLFTNLFLLSTMKLDQTISTTNIDEDCMILRSHALYFAIQNNLLKKIPQAKDIYSIIKKQVILEKKNSRKSRYLWRTDRKSQIEAFSFELKRFEEKIKKKCYNISQNLNEELNIINQQKFKNVLRNKGYLRFLPIILNIYLFFDCAFSCIYCIIMLSPSSIIVDQDVIYFFEIGYSVFSFLECSILPLLFYFSTKKSTYFDRNSFYIIEKEEMLNKTVLKNSN